MDLAGLDDELGGLERDDGAVALGDVSYFKKSIIKALDPGASVTLAPGSMRLRSAYGPSQPVSWSLV